jgi:hypothetical protein
MSQLVVRFVVGQLEKSASSPLFVAGLGREDRSIQQVSAAASVGRAENLRIGRHELLWLRSAQGGPLAMLAHAVRVSHWRVSPVTGGREYR